MTFVSRSRLRLPLFLSFSDRRSSPNDAVTATIAPWYDLAEPRSALGNSDAQAPVNLG